MDTSSTHIAHNNSSMDMEIDTSRRRLAIPSANVSRELLAHSSISSIPYVERMEVQNNDLS